MTACYGREAWFIRQVSAEDGLFWEVIDGNDRVRAVSVNYAACFRKAMERAERDGLKIKIMTYQPRTEPSRADIAAATGRIRAGWTDATRAARAVQSGPGPWQPQVVDTGGIEGYLREPE